MKIWLSTNPLCIIKCKLRTGVKINKNVQKSKMRDKGDLLYLENCWKKKNTKNIDETAPVNMKSTGKIEFSNKKTKKINKER